MTEVDRKTIARLLGEVKRIASHASLTGSLSGGIKLLVQTYNRCLKALKTLDDEQTGTLLAMDLFVELPEDATMDELGVAAALLGSVIKPEEDRNLVCIDGPELHIPKIRLPHPPHMSKGPKVKVTIHRGDEDEDEDEHEDDEHEDER